MEVGCYFSIENVYNKHNIKTDPIAIYILALLHNTCYCSCRIKYKDIDNYNILPFKHLEINIYYSQAFISSGPLFLEDPEF